MFLKPGDLVRIKDTIEVRAYVGKWAGYLAIVDTIDTSVSVSVIIKGTNTRFMIPNNYVELEVGQQMDLFDYVETLFNEQPPEIKCECGAEALGSNKHYDWCIKASK